MYRKIFLLAVLAIAIAACPSFAEGRAVENFTLKDLAGNSVSLEQFRGKIVIVNFWATWCPPCRQEMPEFNELSRELAESGEAVLLAVNLTDGRRDTPEKVAKFIKDNGYSMTVLLDTEQAAASEFGVLYIPSTFVIDAEGRLAGQIQGATTKTAVMELVKEAK